MNQAEFFLANQVNGQLTDAQMLEIMNLPEGDTVESLTTTDSSQPDAAIVPVAYVAKVDETKVIEPEPMLLAKDGKHVIPYEKLTEAREDAQHWKQVAAEAIAKLEQAPKPTPGATAPAAPDATEDESLFGDLSDEAVRAGILKLVNSQIGATKAEIESAVAAALAPILGAQQTSAEDMHFKAIETAHPDVESVVQSVAMNEWIGKQPSFVQAQYKAVIDGGTAEQVIELLDNFKAATGKTEHAPGQKPDALAAAAAAVIAKAKSAPPSSLSEIPASTAAAHNPAEAMLEMSVTSLMNMFEGKNPDQIQALLSKTL